MQNLEDSNTIGSKLYWVCQACGKEALSMPINKGKIQFECSTWHLGVCDVCGQNKNVTETRDFGYPVFVLPTNHLKQYEVNG